MVLPTAHLLASALSLLADQPSVIWQRGTDLQATNLQLLPKGLLDIPLQEAVPWRADLPLEAQRREAGLKEAVKLERLGQETTWDPLAFGPKAPPSLSPCA